VASRRRGALDIDATPTTNLHRTGSTLASGGEQRGVKGVRNYYKLKYPAGCKQDIFCKL